MTFLGRETGTRLDYKGVSAPSGARRLVSGVLEHYGFSDARVLARAGSGQIDLDRQRATPAGP